MEAERLWIGAASLLPGEKTARWPELIAPEGTVLLWTGVTLRVSMEGLIEMRGPETLHCVRENSFVEIDLGEGAKLTLQGAEIPSGLQLDPWTHQNRVKSVAMAGRPIRIEGGERASISLSFDASRCRCEASHDLDVDLELALHGSRA